MAPSLAAKAVAGGFGGGAAFRGALWMVTTETAGAGTGAGAGAGAGAGFSLDDEGARGPGCSAAGASAPENFLDARPAGGA